MKRESHIKTMYTNNGSRQAYECFQHNLSFRYVCENCKILICAACIRQEHAKHTFIRINKFVSKCKNVLNLLIETSRNCTTFLGSDLSNELFYTQCIDEKFNEIMQNIHNSFRPLISALEERNHFLLDYVDRVYKHRMDVLYKQMTALKGSYFDLIGTANMFQNLVENGYGMDIIELAIRIVEGQNEINKSAEMFIYKKQQEYWNRLNVPQFPINILHSNHNQESEELVNEESHMPNANLSNNSFNIFSGPNSSKRKQHSKMLSKNAVKRLQKTTTTTASKTKETAAKTTTKSSTSKTKEYSIMPSNIANICNELTLAGIGKDLNAGIGQAVPGWMEKVKALNCDEPTLAFANQGTEEGQLSRPWGVCVNKSGHIFVTDRRSNNVQAFSADGKFVFKFGRKGGAKGEFDSPVGICVDKSGRIIVADKNNNRIQVFSSGGKFLLTFGDLGTKDGQLKFPFDVAVNMNLQIAVADSANYRIQQFEHNGRFIRQILLGKHSITGCDITPRGICYTPKGRLIITDYTNHCLHLVDLESKKILNTNGSRGSGNFQFNCPSGICCDDDGTIIVADSHNQRIQVFDSNLMSLWSLNIRPSVKSSKSYLNETDRTCDVALTRAGRIVSVTELLPAKEAGAITKRFVHVY